MCNESKTVKVTLISCHELPEIERVGLSLFNALEPQMSDEVTPEAYPHEAAEAVRILMDNDAGAESRFGFEEEEEEDFDEDEPMTVNVNGKEVDIDVLLRECFKQELEGRGERDIEELRDSTVFKTLGEMRRRVSPDGSCEVEISYTEDESMDGTVTTVLYNDSRKNAVSIFREGGVSSSMVCEQGVRHFSVYKTPIMPFELAIYTRSCEGGFTYEDGGVIDIDFIVEIRGADVQRTRMRIYVDVL